MSCRCMELYCDTVCDVTILIHGTVAGMGVTDVLVCVCGTHQCA